MRKIKAFIKAFVESFAELADKVDKGTATGDESLAFGCMYGIIGIIVFFVFIIAALACRTIWHLL